MNTSRVNHLRARFPEPTDKLLEEAGRAIYEEMCEFWTATSALGKAKKGQPPIKLIGWDLLDEEHHLRWINAAKSAYGVFAVAGGARKEQLREIQPGSDEDH